MEVRLPSKVKFLIVPKGPAGAAMITIESLTVTTSSKAEPMELGKLLSAILMIKSTPGTFLLECMENTDSLLGIQASWLRRSIDIFLKLINPPSFLSKIVGAAIQGGDGVSMIVRVTSITMRDQRNLAMSSQAMILSSMVTIPHSVWGIPTMEPLGTVVE